MTFYINGKKPNATNQLGHLLSHCICRSRNFSHDLVFLCIGSDRVTGDSLGPYVGHQLLSCRLPDTHIYGTLKQPVHALNLEKTCIQIQSRHPDTPVIAIDASLGTKKHLGFICLDQGPINPGAGVQKELPPVGDISITGIVGISGFFDYLSLQSTRLSAVVSIAEQITGGILFAYRRLRPDFRSPLFQLGETGRFLFCTNALSSTSEEIR